MVSSKYFYQYVEKDDPDHQAHLLLSYPMYVEKGLKNLDDIVSASAIRLQVGEQAIDPREAEFVATDCLSGFPVPEDAQIAVLTFDIPRSVARLRFPVTVTHLQPNYHYKGALIAAFFFELMKFGFGLFLTNARFYRTVYGAFAILPLALIWIYLTWWITLAGAVIVANLPPIRAGLVRVIRY